LTVAWLMIETTIPEINVSELMDRVRAKVSAIGRLQAHPRLTRVVEPAEIPAAILPKPVLPKTEPISQAIRASRDAITPKKWIPRPFRGLFRRQEKFDREVLRVVEWLSKTNTQLADRLRHLTACVEVQDRTLHDLTQLRQADALWMNHLVGIRDNDIAWMKSMESLAATAANSRTRVTASTQDLEQKVSILHSKNLALDEATAAVTRNAEELQEKLAALAAQVAHRAADDDRRAGESEKQVLGLRGQIESLEERLRALSDQLASTAQHGEQWSTHTNNIHGDHKVLAEAVRVLRSEFNNAAEHIRHLQVQADRTELGARDLQREIASSRGDARLGEQLRAESLERAAIRRDLELLEQRYTSDSAYIKAELSRHSEMVHKFTSLGSTRPTAASRGTVDKNLREVVAHRLDAFYLSFENRFRGPREEIKRRMSFYLPAVEKSRAGKRGRPIIDLGCGRGEWLELLRERKLAAMGVDLNLTMIDQCKERGLRVVAADALEFLGDLPDNSQGAVSGFHIIEHLPLDALVSLVAETFRVLLPGGLALFESPNCKNLTVGACSFYIDPTHRNPVFPETAQFILENVGFEEVKLEYLCPVEKPENVDKESDHLQELLYGPRDFGVIGHKPIGE
jgi:SAM-dependent methyltransferase